MPPDEKLTKVHVELPNNPDLGGESMWAVDLGNDLYELRNVAFHAYDLNFGDVVRATSDSPALKPEIRCVERRSGHRTLRVLFAESVPEERMLDLLQSLALLSASFERATDRYFALDLEPEADVAKVRAVLAGWEWQGWCAYETCEARVPGSFDDSPQEEA